MQEGKVGVVVAAEDSPSTTQFHFILTSEKIKKGNYVFLNSQNKKIFGQVIEIFWSNRYFKSHEVVADISNFGGMDNFPTEAWSYGLAKAKIIGVLDEDRFVRCFFPPKCGEEIFLASALDLQKILNLPPSGLNLGKLLHHELDVKLDLSKLIGKHLAILAMSGAGKSYFCSVLLEEILEIKKEEGRISTLIFDSHQDYTFLKEAYPSAVEVIDAKNLKLSYLSLGVNKIVSMLDLSPRSKFLLEKLFKQIKQKKKTQGIPTPSLDELLEMIEKDNINQNTKAALMEAISMLKSLKFISNKDNFKKSQFPSPGKLIIFDLSSIENLDQKQLLVHYFLSKFFNARKKKKIPPTLAIIEEAHNFCPEKEKASAALSRDIINTIAREGRKFFFCLCLISQRPVNLSTTALSQCSTNVILRITNPNDLEHILQSSEAMDADSLKFIPGLEVGSALILGEVSRFPLFLEIRKRKTSFQRPSKSIQQEAKEFELEQKRIEEELNLHF
ncbi:MAG: ATP-binding protein [Candidatus Anstonellaceae archaeon]